MGGRRGWGWWAWWGLVVFFWRGWWERALGSFYRQSAFFCVSASVSCTRKQSMEVDTKSPVPRSGSDNALPNRREAQPQVSFQSRVRAVSKESWHVKGH